MRCQRRRKELLAPRCHHRHQPQLPALPCRRSMNCTSPRAAEPRSISPTHLRRGTCFPADRSGASACFGAKSTASARHGVLRAHSDRRHARRGLPRAGAQVRAHVPKQAVTTPTPAGFARSSPRKVHNAQTPAPKAPGMGKKSEHHPTLSSVPPSHHPPPLLPPTGLWGPKGRAAAPRHTPGLQGKHK